MSRKLDPETRLRRQLKAKPGDVIDHLLVDAPPCAPDEERAIDTAPMSPEALALKRMIELFDGCISIDFTDKNVAAILEIGGTLALESDRPACATLTAICRDPANPYGPAVVSYHWAPYFVESRADAERQAKFHPDIYAGWNEPPPAPKSAEQLEADAKQAAFEATERAAVLAAERELAAAALVPAKKEAA